MDDVPTRIRAVVIPSQTPDPDRAPRIAQAAAYPKHAWYCIAAVIGFISVCHFVSLLLRLYTKLRGLDAPPSQRTIRLARLPKALLNAFRSFAFRWTVQIGELYTLNLAEISLTAAYITVLFTWSMVNSTSLKGVKYDAHYWANTAGNIASSQLPLMTALGMRNNFLSLLTGVSFDKLIYLHGMTARVLCVLMWLHGAGRMKLGMSGRVSWDHPWIQCGILAATSLTILSIVSLRPIRDYSYEVFLVAHFLLAFITVLSAYFHAQGLELGSCIWPALFLWGLDRFLRLVRLVVYNFTNLKPRRNTELDADVEILTPHFLRIRIQRPHFLYWRPGQSVYLTIPSVSTHETHPFTISTICSPSKLMRTSISESEKDDSRDSSTSSIGDTNLRTLVFFVRVRDGFTKRLLKFSEDHSKVRTFLDGPYGSPPSFVGFSSVVLIAGGSGVAFTLPLLLDIISHAERGHSVCQRVAFIWAIRDLSHIEWVSDAMAPALGNVSSSLRLSVELFITASTREAQSWNDDLVEDDPEAKTTKSKRTAILSSPLVHAHQGRPDLQQLLDSEIAQAYGDISVTVCGTHALASAVRNALRTPRFIDILRGGPAVFLHVQAFGKA